MKIDKIFSRLLGNRSFLIAAICMFMITAAFSLNGYAQSNELILSDRIEEQKDNGENVIEGEISFNNNSFSEIAQAGSYVFATTTAGSLTDMSTGTTQLVAANVDDSPASPLTNIGFDFYFQGARYSQFSVNANGVIRLGAVSQTASPYQPLAQANNPIITAYGADQRTHTSGKVHFMVTGAPGNRVLIIEWLNMQSNFNTGGTADLTYQARLYETSGVIEFVYGNMTMSTLGAADANSNDPHIGFSSSNTANTVGSVTAPYDGTVTPTFDGASNDPVENLYNTAGPIPVLTSAADGVRRTFSFTPPVPSAPSGLNFTGVSGSAITLNWTDNSANEDLFAIYRSTDGVNYSYVGAAAEDATSFNDTGLNPGTNYFYQVYAVSEGALSTVLSGSQATNPAGNDACNGAGGNWSETTTWADGTVPTSTDNVVIGSGCTVTVDVTTAVAFNVTIDSGGTLQSPTTGAVTSNNLTVSRSVTNNGTLDFSTNGNTSGAILTFGAGSDDVTFGGTGATTDVRSIVVAKGARATVVELTATNFTVQGVDTDAAGFLTLTSGTFKISGSFTATNRIFTVAGYSIPALGGLWLNNPNFTVAGQNGSPTVTGLLRMTQGTLNVGTSTGNSMGFATGSVINIEGGAVNTAGRFGVAASTNAINYTQSSGTITVQTVGNTSTTLAGFDMGTSLLSNINISGGTIIVQIANTAASGPRDYRNQAGGGIAGVTGGTLQLGNSLSGAAKTFIMRGVVPNLVVDNTSAGHTGQWDITLTNYNNISLNITVNTGATVNFGNVLFLFAGQTLTNNGTMTHNGASSRFITFNSTQAQTYTGSGTVTAPMTSFEFQSDLGFTFDPSVSTIVTNRIINFIGNVINSNKLTVGNGGATTAVIQIGNTTTPTAAGTFDTQVGFNPGTGGINITYLRTTLSRTTGGEIPATRTISNLTYDDNDPSHTLTIAGGDLTATGALTLTNGVVLTGANTLIHNGAATRTNGYVNGNLSRSYTATGAYTYHVGQNGYSPVLATVTALGTNPSSLTVLPVDITLPGLTPANSVSRYWSLTENGDLTADLAFTYLDEDVNGNEGDYRVFKLAGGVLTNQCSGGPCVNEAANTATVTGISDFSAWGIGEAAAAASGELAFDSATYSVNEDGTTATITVNRTGGSANTVTVDYATVAGGTATGGAACTAGVDYINASGILTFTNDETSQTFTVTICDDSDVEGNETVNLALSNPTGGATIGAQNTAVLTIVDVELPSGNVIVNPGNVAYMTLGEAVAAINAGTHTGAVTVDIFANTTETGPVVLNGSGAGAASYTSVVISPKADGVMVAGPSVQGRGLIELNGADNVTIDGDNPNTAGINRNLTLQNTAANTTTFTSVIRIATNITTVNSADNNIFRNLNVVGSSTGRNIATATSTTASENTTFGIFSGPNATGDVTAPNPITSVLTGVAAGATVTNLNVSNNSFATTARAVSINGSATSVHTGLQIRNNFIGNPVAGDVNQVTAIGITANGATNPVIAGNTIYIEGFIRSSAATHAINVGVNSTNTTGATIERNMVNRAQNNDLQTWAAYGINIAGIAASAHTVRNNFVSGVINNQTGGTGGFGTTFGAYGIRVASGTGHQIYHNSVNLYGMMQGVTSTNLTASFMIVGTGQTGLDVRNNIFVNTISGGNPTGTRNVAIYVPTGGTSAMNLTLNNNDYFVGSDALNRMAQRGPTFGTGEYTLADFDPTDTANPLNFRNYSSTLSAAGTNDNASKKVDPQFVSNTDLHILPTSQVESGGVNVGVTDDIDGDMRPAAPDIGADEISVAGPGIVQFSTTNFSGSEGTTATINVIRSAGTDGTVGVTATITDGTATGGAACTAGVDYINPGVQVLSFGNGVSLQSFTIDLCTDALLEAGETVNLTLSNPTGGTTIGTNNPATLTIVDVPPPFTGTINVGTGETITSLTNPGGVFQAINGAGLSGNLTVNITSDLTAETGTVALNQFTETGAGGYTLTFKPSGAARTISGSTAATAGLIKLSGADRVIFDGSLNGGTDRSLTINQTGPGAIIWIATDGANGSNNDTVKNTILLGAGTSQGVIAGSGTTLGGAGTAPQNNNTIQNNNVRAVQNAAFISGIAATDMNWTIVDNEVGSTVDAEKLIFRGFILINSTNMTVSRNKIIGVRSQAASTATMSGIQVAGTISSGQITRNEIRDIKQINPTGFGSNGIFSSATSTTSNLLIANNFVSDVASQGATGVLATNNGYGIAIASGGGYNIYYNSVNMNTDQVNAASTTAALNITVAVTTAGSIDLRNNILVNTQTVGTRYAVIDNSTQGAAVFSTINYNDYFAQNVGFLTTPRTTLADWQTATGQDANSLAVNPLFVSATDLHLQAGSPVINAGTPIAGITTDIDGETRSATTPDIGADEFVAPVQPGTLQFSSATYTVAEAGGTVTLTVTRTGGSDGAVTADYTLGGGTATGGAACGGSVDYVNTGGTVSFADGETSKTFDVTICNDAAFEGNETFNATLSNATGGATIGTPNPATVTITDDDPAPGTITVNDVRVFEGNSGTVNAVFTLTYVGTSPGTASVQYATANGTATAGVDYVATSGTVNFGLTLGNGPQTVERTVTVAVIGDTVKEANETFFLNLSNAVNASISDGQGVGIIIDKDRSYISDFDNDKVSDYTVYRPGTNVWYVLQSTNGIPKLTTLGSSGDIAVPGDYDGDGIADVAVFRPSEGTWYILQSMGKALRIANWGTNGDIPVQGDYDGDGKTDLAVFRPSNGTWYIFRSSDETATISQFGLGTDIPVTGDFDGDFKNDLTVFRGGTWYTFQSSTNSVSIVNWGSASDKPVANDYDGDGSVDHAIYRNGEWWILPSLSDNFYVVNFGLSTDIPTPADFDGDGTTDVAVFRPSSGDWYVLRSSDSALTGINWGIAGDVPAPTAYMPQP